LAAGAAPAAPQGQEDKGHKSPDSLDFSGSDKIQLRGWIAQLWLVIPHKPGSFPNEQSKMWYASKHLRGIFSAQILPHI